MAVSGTISTTTFNTLKVIDTAFRRCRLPAQSITPEMQGYARDALYLVLSEIASVKAPSWCVERQVYPLYEGQAQVALDAGTVDVMNANLRTLQEVTGATVSLSTSYTVDCGADGQGAVSTVGVKWSGAAVALTFQVSDDNATWVTVGTQTTSASAGQWTWTDISPVVVHRYFRFTSVDPLLMSQVYLGTLPQEIPMGVLNRDTYVAQSNKVFPGRPLTYWFQRGQIIPVMNLWPAPNAAAEYQQLIIWRQRHIMDVGTLAQSIEVPQRWLNAVIDMLAVKVAAETPSVDAALLPRLDALAAQSYQTARDGDNSGSPTFLQPAIRGYTR